MRVGIIKAHVYNSNVESFYFNVNGLFAVSKMSHFQIVALVDAAERNKSNVIYRWCDKVGGGRTYW